MHVELSRLATLPVDDLYAVPRLSMATTVVDLEPYALHAGDVPAVDQEVGHRGVHGVRLEPFVDRPLGPGQRDAAFAVERLRRRAHPCRQRHKERDGVAPKPLTVEGARRPEVGVAGSRRVVDDERPTAARSRTAERGALRAAEREPGPDG